jgi:hypothetical protein
VVAKSELVQNHLPAGSSWDGRTDLPMDEATFKQMMSDIDPNAPQPGAPARAPGAAVPASAPAAPSTPAPATAPPTS